MALIVVEFLPLWLAPDNVSEEEVLDSLRLKRALDVFLVEVGGVTCVRTRPDIHNHLGFVLPQQLNEFLNRVVRVPDCKCRQFRHHGSLFPESHSRSLLNVRSYHNPVDPVYLSQNACFGLEDALGLPGRQ